MGKKRPRDTPTKASPAKTAKVTPTKPTPAKSLTPKAKRAKLSEPTPVKNRPAPKKKSPKKAIRGATLQIAPSSDASGLDRSIITEAVKQLVSNLKEKAAKGSALFSGDGGKVQLQLAGIKVPNETKRQILRINLPHPYLPEPYDVCLIVKDLEKGIRPDHEPTLHHFTKILEDKDAKALINTVMPLRELKVEYKAYEAKTQLCHRFDKLLADDRILRLVPKFLGKPFYKRKMLPVAVNMNAKNLKAEIEKALQTVTLPLKFHGASSLVTVSHADLPLNDTVDNIMKVGDAISKQYPGGFMNIRSIFIKGENSISVPIFLSTKSPNDVVFEGMRLPKKKVPKSSKISNKQE